MSEARRVEERIEQVRARADTRAEAIREATRRRLAKLRRDERKKIEAIRAGADATRLSANGAELIASFEGWVDHVYLDAAGLPTIGFGHLLKPGEHFPAQISRERGLDLLRADAKIAAEAVDRLVTVNLSQNEFDALVSLTFNIGTGAFGESTLLRVLNSGNRAGAAEQFLRWTIAGGVELQGLVNRRRAERALFLRK